MHRLLTLGLAATVGGCASNGDGASSGVTATETTATSTTAATGSGGSSTSGASTGAASGSSTGGSGSTTATTGVVDPDCAINADCELVDTCCGCEAVPLREAGTPCPEEDCATPVCTEFSVAGAECRLGVCRPMRVNCGENKVACPEPPPACNLGFLAEVDDTGCVTGRCVPARLCDEVPDCTACTTDQICVVDESGASPVHRCEPLPAACAGVPTCDCATGACPFGTMCQESRGTLVCSG